MYQEFSEDHKGKEMASRKEYAVANYYVAIAVGTILLYVLNNLRYMNISLVTADFTSCLWAVNLALGMGIIGNFLLLLNRARWFHNLVQAILSALAIFGVYTIYTIFPFELGAGIWPTVAKAILILIMAGIAIGFILDFLQKEKHRDVNPSTDNINQTPM
jgi:hypothetical protein